MRIWIELRKAEDAQRPGDQARHWLRLAQAEMRRAHYGQADEHMRHGLELVQTLPPPDRAELQASYLMMQGKLAGNRGQYAAARSCFDQGLELARQAEFHGLECDFLMHLGKLAGNLGEYERAKAHLEIGLAGAKTLRSAAQICGFLMHLGWVLGNQGNYRDAQYCFEQGLAIAEPRAAERRAKTMWAELESGLRLNLGWLAHRLGAYGEAIEHLERGLKQAQEIGHSVRVCGLRENLSTVAWCQGEFLEAQRFAREGLAEARKVYHPARTCGLLECLSRVLISQGRYREARVHLEEGLELAAQLDYPLRRCGLLQARGWLHVQQWHEQEAQVERQARGGTEIEQWHEQEALSDLMGALLLAHQIRHRFLESSTLLLIGEMRLLQLRCKKAEAAFGAAQRYARQVRLRQEGGEVLPRGILALPQLEGQALYGLARAAAGQGDKTRACEHARQSHHILQRIGFHQDHEVTTFLQGIKRS
jgi:tetratricopeptide (TPR) repeat protein